MPATVTPNPEHVRRHTAYCDQCGDGINASRRDAEEWAERHNKRHGGAS